MPANCAAQMLYSQLEIWITHKYMYAHAHISNRYDRIHFHILPEVKSVRTSNLQMLSYTPHNNDDDMSCLKQLLLFLLLNQFELFDDLVFWDSLAKLFNNFCFAHFGLRGT